MLGEDTFLPHIESVFYAIFHEKRGPLIFHQAPDGLITQGSSSALVSNFQSSRSPVSGIRPSRAFESSVTGVGGPTKSLTSSHAPTVENLAKLRESPSPIDNGLSTSTRDLSAPPSPASYRSSHRRRTATANISTTASPQKPSQPGNGLITPLFDFSDVSRFVIPAQDMCGRLVICSAQKHRVIGFPICLEAEKYERVHFRYNLCFVFDRAADLSCYEPVVRKIARVLMACEVGGFIEKQSQLCF